MYLQESVLNPYLQTQKTTYVQERKVINDKKGKLYKCQIINEYSRPLVSTDVEPAVMEG